MFVAQHRCIQYLVFQALEAASTLESLVVSVMLSANSALSEMYDRYTVAEWIEQKVYPMHHKLLTLRRKAELVKRVRKWPARPYQPLPELELLGVGVVTTLPTVATLAQVQKRRVQAPDYYSSRRRKGG